LNARKPIIGIAGGIGSGKSTVARMFGDFGCLVLNADDHVRELYDAPDVKRTLREWWGDSVFDTQGKVDRGAIAGRIFNDTAERHRLETLLHPRVDQIRRATMNAAADDAQVVAFVWDIPLLFEVGLNAQCDAVVFVDAPLQRRLDRVRRSRGWDENDLLRREKLQLPLDNKRQMSNYIIQNTADVGSTQRQVREILSEILSDARVR
jgi:dephospho-CoA kinase